MAEKDFMEDILAEADGQNQSAESKALDNLKKFNLPSRFTIQTDKAVNQFSGQFSKAFEVLDQKHKDDIYSVILPSTIPIRFHVIQQLKLCFNTNLSNVVESGLTNVAGGQYGNFAVILEKPKGRKLSEVVREVKKQKLEDPNYAKMEYKLIMTEEFIESELVAPINEVLKTLAENNVSHGRLNHDNIYVQGITDAKLMVGECISEPCGYSQPAQYETVERAQAMPIGKGNCQQKHDYFALGVLVYYCLFGEVPAAGVDIGEQLKNRINKGTYNYYLGSSEVPPRMTDILRGLLTDNASERWGYEQVLQWLKGKRFNLIRPSVRKEAVRNYDFLEGLYSNKRGLALAYYQKWDEAAFDIRDKRLGKWLELSAADKNTAADISSVVGATGGEKTKSRQDNDELVAKTLIILDPAAPIRFRDLCVHLDGLGVVLAHAWQRQSQLELAQFVEIIRTNLGDFKATHDGETEKLDRWVLQRQPAYIRYKSLGFGVERVMYDLNPTLPCQSSMLANQFVIDTSQLLMCLNENSSKLSTNDPVDRHIAAFIASKLDLATEIRIKIMNRFRKNEAAVMQITKLALLAFAQKRSKITKLPGLANWMNDKLKPIVNTIHGKKIRKDFGDALKDLANQGSLEGMLSLITNSDFFARDDEGFNEARARYAMLDADLRQIKEREKRGMTQDSFYLYGLQFAKIFAALVFIITLGLMGT